MINRSSAEQEIVKLRSRSREKIVSLFSNFISSGQKKKDFVYQHQKILMWEGYLISPRSYEKTRKLKWCHFQFFNLKEKAGDVCGTVAQVRNKSVILVDFLKLPLALKLPFKINLMSIRAPSLC